MATVRRADSDPDFARFGVTRNQIEAREDGRRENGDPGRFEWWYFEVRLRFGAIVIAFMDKPMTDATGPLAPLVSIRGQLWLSPSGGETHFPPAAFDSQASKCDVTIDSNFCRDEGAGVYRLEFHGSGIDGSITLRASAPPARIGTGHLLFENASTNQYLGWIVAVPCGDADVDCVIDGRVVRETGSGYHDHNWGDQPMSSAIHHWYWGRADIGGFTIIFANVTSQPDYGSLDLAEVILIEGGKTIAFGSHGVSFLTGKQLLDPKTQKPLARALTVELVAGGARYVFSFASLMSLFRKEEGDAAYHRDLAMCTMLVERGGNVTVHGPVRTSYEMMWFGDANPIDAGAVFQGGLTDAAFVPEDIGFTIQRS